MQPGASCVSHLVLQNGSLASDAMLTATHTDAREAWPLQILEIRASRLTPRCDSLIRDAVCATALHEQRRGAETGTVYL